MTISTTDPTSVDPAPTEPVRLLDQPVGSTWTLLGSGATDADAPSKAPVGRGEVHRTVLPGGLRVITERIPTVRSVTVGAWVDVGSRDETPSLAGATHYLEHMVFKGTRQRSPMEISAAVEAAGGDLNAFTSKEYTCYHAQVLDTEVEVAVDVVTDMVTSALVRTRDVDLERPVVLEEIAMHADDPADAVQEHSHRALWGDARIGRPVIGTVESVSALSGSQLRRWYRTRYTSEHVVLAAAGNVDHDQVVGLARRAFQAKDALGAVDRQPRAPRQAGTAPRGRNDLVLDERPTEQASLVLAVPGVARNDPRRYAQSVLSLVLGGGMSSRLFQEVREERGLAYSIGMFQNRYVETGMLGVQVGTSAKRTPEVLALVRDLLADAASKGIREDELERGKGQLKGSLVIGLEDTSSRMGRLAMAELVHGELLSIDETLRRIDAVCLDAVRAIAGELLTATPALAAVGPFPERSVLEEAIAA